MRYVFYHPDWVYGNDPSYLPREEAFYHSIRDALDVCGLGSVKAEYRLLGDCAVVIVTDIPSFEHFDNVWIAAYFPTPVWRCSDVKDDGDLVDGVLIRDPRDRYERLYQSNAEQFTLYRDILFTYSDVHLVQSDRTPSTLIYDAPRFTPRGLCRLPSAWRRVAWETPSTITGVWVFARDPSAYILRGLPDCAYVDGLRELGLLNQKEMNPFVAWDHFTSLRQKPKFKIRRGAG